MGRGVVWGQRLGHLALDMEVYLLECDFGIRPWDDTFTMWEPVANQWLADKVAARLTMVAGDDHRCDIEWHAGVDPHGLVEQTPPYTHVGFTGAEVHDGRMAAFELGIEESHVVVHGRDAAYLDAALGGDGRWSYHDYRDVDIDTYLPAMHTIVEQGHAAVRLGHTVAKPLGHTGPGIIDYPLTDLRSDFLDCWLVATSRWMLAASSGPCALAALFRRPIAFANIAPFLTIADPLFPMGRLFIPKLYRSLDDGHILSVREIVARGGLTWWHTQEYTDNRVELVDNTPDEIAALAHEMDYRLEGLTGDFYYGREEEEQAAFWKAAGMAQPPKLRIGTGFLREHAHELLA